MANTKKPLKKAKTAKKPAPRKSKETHPKAKGKPKPKEGAIYEEDWADQWDDDADDFSEEE